jgi:hypothetical protein
MADYQIDQWGALNGRELTPKKQWLPQLRQAHHLFHACFFSFLLAIPGQEQPTLQFAKGWRKWPRLYSAEATAMLTAYEANSL